jgi:hypothetical protein
VKREAHPETDDEEAELRRTSKDDIVQMLFRYSSDIVQDIQSG